MKDSITSFEKVLINVNEHVEVKSIWYILLMKFSNSN